MAEQGKLFHESWYRIAGQRICLRPSVVVQRQMFRGTRWYVVRDLFSNQFYRLNPGTYQFVSRLNANRSVEEVWNETRERDPEQSPGQGEVIELLAQLYHANLLQYHLPPNSAKLFERYRKKKQRILQANLKSIMFLRIPLFDPSALLQRLFPLFRWLISPLGAVVWLLAVGAGLQVAADHFGELRVQSQGVLAPANLFLLYLGMVIVKTLHEFGHAFMVRRFGGEVHTMGVMFLIFNPLPYMDASAAWAFRNKWQRVLVGAAGMIFEIFVAAWAILVWANTGPGVVNALAYNMAFIASVSTILFNINPLLRFDGYYILSDLLDMPNLHQHASQHLKYLVEKYAFGCKHCETPARTWRERIWFTAFGLLSGVYRVFVFSSILLFVADRFLLAGLIMAAICVVTWGIIPIVNILRYLGTSPRLHRTRGRAIAVCGTTCLALCGLLFVWPFPFSIQAPGVLKSTDYVVVANRAAGQVVEILMPSGARVNSGDPLLRVSNAELPLRIRESQAGLEEAQARYRKAMHDQRADLAPIFSRIAYYQKRLERLAQEQDDLVVKSEVGGIWVAPDLADRLGMWVVRGSSLGEVVNDDRFYFVSVVSQENVSELFAHGLQQTEVKLAGEAGVRVPVKEFATIPLEQRHLPSASLGWGAGGEVPIDLTEGGGMKTSEPYFQVRASIETHPEVFLLHGRSGRIRFSLAPRSLGWQGWRKFLQLIQKRYQL